MWCISAYEYVVGKANMTKILAIYLQASSFLFSTISHRFIIKTYVSDDILDFSGLLNALATLNVLCWIKSVMVSHMMLMSDTSCSVSSQFLNSSWNSIFFDPIRVTSTLGGLLVINSFPFHLYDQFDVAHTQSLVTLNVDLVDDCYVCDDVCLLGCTPVVNFSLHYTVWAYPCPSPACFLLEHGIHDFQLS